MNGPRARDEECVKGFFSKFGGIKDVKVIFPSKLLTNSFFRRRLNSSTIAGGRSAFVFVKFDNTEACCLPRGSSGRTQDS